jgi:hypothetical protein
MSKNPPIRIGWASLLFRSKEKRRRDIGSEKAGVSKQGVEEVLKARNGDIRRCTCCRREGAGTGSAIGCTTCGYSNNSYHSVVNRNGNRGENARHKKESGPSEGASTNGALNIRRGTGRRVR